MAPCYACRILRKKRSFTLARICSECLRLNASCFQRRPSRVKNARQRRQLSTDISKALNQRRRLRMNELSVLQRGSGVSSGLTSAYQGKQALSQGGLFLRTPFSTTPAEGSSLSNVSPRPRESSDARTFGVANDPLVTKPYQDMFTDGGLPPMFALLSHYLSTKYPGVRRVILEVDNMPQADSDHSRHPQPEQINKDN